jgi:hypothetical protein
MLGGIGIWQLLLIMILPLVHVVVSSRSYGGAKFGWSLAVLFFPLLGYIIYLIVTQPAKKAQQS